VDAITGWMQRRQSRRGFLAMCGKASLSSSRFRSAQAAALQSGNVARRAICLPGHSAKALRAAYGEIRELLSLALGMAMAGASKLALVAHAQCCPGPTCDSLGFVCIPPVTCGAPAVGCPPGCFHNGAGNTQCCDVGTSTIHFCYSCKCLGQQCSCECDTGVAC